VACFHENSARECRDLDSCSIPRRGANAKMRAETDLVPQQTKADSRKVVRNTVDYDLITLNDSRPTPSRRSQYDRLPPSPPDALDNSLEPPVVEAEQVPSDSFRASKAKISCALCDSRNLALGFRALLRRVAVARVVTLRTCVLELWATSGVRDCRHCCNG
jgi:hypothetical protein